MNKFLAYMTVPALLLVSCSRSLELDEVEAGFSERGPLPEVSIDASKIDIQEYDQQVTLSVTFSGVTADMDSLELGLLSATDPGFVESKVTLLETPADGTYNMTVAVSAGRTNYIKAMAATTDGAVYSDRITVDVPDIPWYYKIVDEYVGNYGPDSYSGLTTTYDNHAVRVEVAEDLSTVTFYDFDPYIQATLTEDESYNSSRMNYITGALDLDARTVTFTVAGYGCDVHASPYLVSPITSYSEDGYGLGQSFVLTFNEDASEIQIPWYAIFDQQEQNLPFVYSENGITLSAN